MTKEKRGGKDREGKGGEAGRKREERELFAGRQSPTADVSGIAGKELCGKRLSAVTFYLFHHFTQ